MALPTLPLPALVSMLHCHLQEVRDNPTEVLNEKLLEEFNSQSSSMWRLPSRPWSHSCCRQVLLGLPGIWNTYMLTASYQERSKNHREMPSLTSSPTSSLLYSKILRRSQTSSTSWSCQIMALPGFLQSTHRSTSQLVFHPQYLLSTSRSFPSSRRRCIGKATSI